MATSKSFKEFAKRMVVVAKGTEDKIEKTIRKAALAADQVAVNATPVDTGRARGGWIASVGTPSQEGSAPAGPGKAEGGSPESNAAQAAAKALQQAEQVVSEYKLDAGSIFLANNVEYIVKLDNGSSKQAPAGMTAAALAAARNVVRKANRGS